MRDLAGKTAFVTGAASGIGFGIATALAQAGVKVMLCDIEEAALTKAAADLKLINADVDGVKADVSLKGELQAAADATMNTKLKFAFEKETKGAVRYQEVGEDGAPAFAPQVGTLYVRKSSMPGGKIPKTLIVTIASE